ncbi:MAG: hypothetical protein ACXW3D_08210 [Caulobacteraceae bacterium]
MTGSITDYNNSQNPSQNNQQGGENLANRQPFEPQSADQSFQGAGGDPVEGGREQGLEGVGGLRGQGGGQNDEQTQQDVGGGQGVSTGGSASVGGEDRTFSQQTETTMAGEEADEATERGNDQANTGFGQGV